MSYVDHWKAEWDKLTPFQRNALIAEHVCKWPKMRTPAFDYDGPCQSNEVLVPPTMTEEEFFHSLPNRGTVPPWWFCPQFTNGLQEAFRLLEGYYPWPECYQRIIRTQSGNWRCDIELFYGDGPTHSFYAKELPEAIGGACLRATGYKFPEEVAEKHEQ